MKKDDAKKICFLICFWELCAIFIALYDASVLGFQSEVGGEDYSLIRNMVSAMIVCFLGTSILGSIEVLFFGKLFRKKPLGLSLLIKTAVYMTFIIFFTSLATVIIYSAELDKPFYSFYIIRLYLSNYLKIRMGMIIVYWSIVCFLALFMLQISKKYGQGVLSSFFYGKYHKPKEAKRIFLMMDLKSSTTYAEQLGHLKYSRLIQDCFYDLTDIILDHEAKVYQYVGDEVVLTWDTKNGIHQGNCIKTYFAYDQLLQSKTDYYQNQYGVVPEFKASINMGTVTVAEVGELKKELAYHGDVLNTAKRIQDNCNQYQKKLLISEKVKEKFASEELFDFEFLGNVHLKGKEKTVNIYAVNSVLN